MAQLKKGVRVREGGGFEDLIQSLVSLALSVRRVVPKDAWIEPGS